MYKKILVPMALDHDISQRTLAVAKALCSEDGQIIALHVYETPQGSVSTFLDANIVKEGFDNARTQLHAKTAGLEDVDVEIVKGHTYRTIVDYAGSNDIECIVMGSHKPGIGDYLLGSTAARVVRHAPCAVHVYRSS